MRTAVCAAFVVALAQSPTHADDWPTYLHDNARSGQTAESLSPPLVLAWKFLHAPPDPAWTEPAKEAARVRFDDAYHAVVAGGQVYFGSSGDNKVYALDAESGEVVWTFFTGGPVRLAPTVAGERVYFGSDDGLAYCVRAKDGELVWKVRAAYTLDRVIGHGRMISLWPVRTGVLIEDGVAYFGAGIFPAESVYVCAADARDGKILWRNDLTGERGPEQKYDGISPQGYLLASPSILYVPSGRSMPAAFRRTDGAFQFYVDPGGKVGGTYALLLDKHLVAGVNDQRVFDRETGKSSKAGYAWAPANRLIVTQDTSYSLTDHQLLALNRQKRGEVLGDRNKVAGQRQTAQKELRALYRKRYRLKKSDPKYDTQYAELTRKIDEQTTAVEKLQGEQEGIEAQSYRWKRDTGCNDSLVLTGNALVAGGQGRVELVDRETGKWLWTGTVDGRASGLAVSDGRLFVSTDTGAIYCFAMKTPDHVADVVTPDINPTLYYDDDRISATYRRAADRIVSATGVREGFCLVLGCGIGRLAHELAKRTDLQIYGVDDDPENVAEARRLLDAAGLYGRRVTIDLAGYEDLPYPSYFADLIVSDDLVQDESLSGSMDELFRVLRPCGGIAYLGRPSRATSKKSAQQIEDLVEPLRRAGAKDVVVERDAKRDGGVWLRVTRGPLPGAGSWTHLYADPGKSANSGDQLVRTPLGVTWFGSPGPERMVERHARAAGPVSMDGRLFVQGENVIFAHDAYNGRRLWKREIPGAIRVRVDVDGGNLAVAADGLYVAVRDLALRLDVETGETRQIYALPRGNDGQRWGALVVADGTLVGTSAAPLLEHYGARWQNPSDDPASNRKAYATFNASGRMWRYMQEWPDWGREDTWKGAVTERMITSRSIFALDTKTQNVLWERVGKISPTSIAVGDGKVLYADSNVSAAEKKEAVDARRELYGLLKGEDEKIKSYDDYDVRRLILLDLRKGSEIWNRLVDVTGCGGNKLGTAFHDGVFLVMGHFSNHDRGPFESGKLAWRRIVAMAAADGYIMWTRQMNYLRRPMVIGSELVIEPRACDIKTGKIKTRKHPITGEEVPWEYKRGGHSCGVNTGSAHCFFFRSDSINYYDFSRDHGMLPIGGTRAGCWINMITANGVALLPEASAGCTCSFPIRTTIAMAPKKRDRAWTIYTSPGAVTPVKNWFINLGAPGDRKDENGAVWFGYPRLSVNYGQKFSLGEKVAAGKGFFAHASDAVPIRNTDKPWIFSSGVEGLQSCNLPVLGKRDPPRAYTVRLGFCEPQHEDPGKRVFDVKLQGKTVLEAFDISKEAGGRNAAIVKEFRGVLVREAVTIELGEAGILNSIEVVAE